MQDLKAFLRLQTDAWLLELRDKVASDLAKNVSYTNLSMGGNKNVSQQQLVKVEQLASDLAIVIVERGLQGTEYKAPTRLSVGRIA